MKNQQKGFVVPLLVAIIALLVVSAGVYVYENKKAEVPIVTNTEIQQPDQVQQQTNTQTLPVNTQTINSNSIDTSNWKTYTNSNPAFSFNYPSSWNPPVINQQNTRVFTDFGNGFSVTTGFYYDQVKGRNSTVLEIINGYKNSSTIKNVQTENIKVDGHLATKITYYGSDTKKNYTDVYIYQDQQIQEKFIELNADDSVDATTFNQILSTFKFTTQTI